MSFKLFKDSKDALLIKAMSNEDSDIYTEIYKRYSPALRTFVSRLIKNRTKAEDIVHNIFMKLLTSKPIFDSVASMKNWLYVCARNEVIDSLRSMWEKNVDKAPSCPDVLTDGLDVSTLMPYLNSVLDDMPEKRANIFRLSRIQGLSAEDIAMRLGISVRTVHKHLEVANKEVRQKVS